MPTRHELNVEYETERAQKREAPMTDAMREALKWLREHNGSGGFEKYPRHHVLLAGGEEAPFMWTTWKKLAAAGYIEIKNRRVTLLEPHP